MSRILLLAATVVLFAASVAAHPAQAQRGADAQNRVRVAVVPSLPVATASALIIRTSDAPPLVVMDQQHADPTTLGMALALVRKIRSAPLAPGEQQVVPIQGGVARTAPSATRSAFLNAQLRRLEARPAGRIGALGVGRYIEIIDEVLVSRLGSS